jgi:hypothetical protein
MKIMLKTAIPASLEANKSQMVADESQIAADVSQTNRR